MKKKPGHLKKKHRRVKKKLAVTVAIIALVIVALGRFGPSVQEKKVYYHAAVWSPDVKSVAYMTRTMEYSFTKPFLKLPVITPERSYTFSKDALELVIDPVDKGKARVIKKFDLEAEKLDPTDLGSVDARLGWYLKGYLQYSVVTSGFSKNLDTGNYFIGPNGKGEVFVAPSEDAKRKIISSFPTLSGNKELFPRGIAASLYIFDHNTKKVRLLMGDDKAPVPKYRTKVELQEASK